MKTHTRPGTIWDIINELDDYSHGRYWFKNLLNDVPEPEYILFEPGTKLMKHYPDGGWAKILVCYAFESEVPALPNDSFYGVITASDEIQLVGLIQEFKVNSFATSDIISA